MSKSGPKLARHLRDLAKFLDSLSPAELKAFEEIKSYVEKTTDNLQHKKDSVLAETNEYERQYTSFFGLAISFVVAGMLSSPPGHGATFANRFFYIAAIVSAIVAGVFLFFEYRFVSKHFDKWTAGLDDAMSYVKNGPWENPSGLSNWLDERQAKIPKRSTSAIQRIEFALVSIAFLMLALWLTESLFNPNWPIFDGSSLTHSSAPVCKPHKE